MTTKYDSMTNEQLKRETAERVCGFKRLGRYWVAPRNGYDEVVDLPELTTSFDTCLEHLIPAMGEKDLAVFINNGEDKWDVEFGLLGTIQLLGEYHHKSLPRATCISALLALDAMEER